MQPHENYIKSSNLIFITIGLGTINLFLARGIFSSIFAVVVGVLTLLFIFGLGCLIRQGLRWVKYFFLAIMLFGLIGIPYVIQNLAQAPAVGIINIIQTVLQVWALLLLFKIPKEEA